ncbi:hypothetical protein [Terribacillus sp. 7520-G]|uniref:hypothetical protein n=1 Tax=Terribacillus sp. 7520-G TaxID=2025389 RepID=UPI000BA74BCC|nr:hypothetical protein [Terribacillus sp. 7520-G]PAD39827.1 hypothetical protein CHH53_04085 [Terribacillus sp. 7520-G]
MSQELILEEHVDLAYGFIRAVKGNNVNLYWSFISKVDKARVFGMYRSFVQSEHFKGEDFRKYIKEYFMREHAKKYNGLDNAPGISTTKRYTDLGDVKLYLLNNVEEPMIIDSPTEMNVFPITVTYDCYLKGNNEIKGEWKVRMYEDDLYNDLDQTESL